MPDPSQIVFIKPDRAPGAVKLRRKPRERLAPRIDFSTVKLEPTPVIADPYHGVPEEDIAPEARSKPDDNPVAIVTRSRRQQIYMPKPVQGVEGHEKTRKERDYPLDPCPLCGGKAKFEELGTYTPLWSVVCQECYCATQSYGSKYWAAWRWNTRQVPFPKDDVPPDFAPVFSEAEKPDKPIESVTVKKSKPKTQDSHGQLLFGFMEDDDGKVRQ